MADKKITQLTNITGANLVDADEFVVVDISADETKAITLGELKEAFDSGSGFVRITGDTMTGDLGFGDNDKAIFGAGSDLQIYHDGTNSYISDQGTGNLKILGTSMNIQSAAGENYIEAVNNAHVKLFYNAAEKLATTSTGIDVTGTVTADGLTVDGDGQINQTAGNASTLTFTSNGQASRYSRIKVDTDRSLILTAGVGAVNETPDIKLQTGTSTGEKDRLLIDGATGDISFYEDTGTTPKFFWDASAESLAVGGSSGYTAAKITGVQQSDTAGVLSIGLGAGGGTAQGFRLTSSNAIAFDRYNAGWFESMRIDSSGNLLVSTTAATVPSDGAVLAVAGGNSHSFAKSGKAAVILNRSTSDGDIAQFRKDNTTVGSIGANGSNIYIAGSATYPTGIRFYNAGMNPCDSTGAYVDNARDVGASNVRWRNLYLSGGVYLGGTGAANKLDDYETGTWTPVLKASGGTKTWTYSAQSGYYRKVGGQVTVWYNIQLSSDGSGTDGNAYIDGLPFTSANSSNLVAHYSVAWKQLVETGDVGLMTRQQVNTATIGILDGSSAYPDVTFINTSVFLNDRRIRGTMTYLV